MGTTVEGLAETTEEYSCTAIAVLGTAGKIYPRWGVLHQFGCSATLVVRRGDQHSESGILHVLCAVSYQHSCDLQGRTITFRTLLLTRHPGGHRSSS